MIQIENAKTTFFISKEQYLEFKKAWAKLAQDKKVTAAHIVLYNVLRAKPSIRGFTPVTKQVKLNNGHRPEGAYIDALDSLRTYCECITKGKVGWQRKAADEFQGTLPGHITLGMMNLLEKYLQ